MGECSFKNAEYDFFPEALQLWLQSEQTRFEQNHNANPNQNLKGTLKGNKNSVIIYIMSFLTCMTLSSAEHKRYLEV